MFSVSFATVLSYPAVVVVWNMHSTKKINFGTIQLVRLRHGDGKSSAKIAEELIALGHNIKPSTVRSYVRIYEDERKGVIRPEKKLLPQNTPFVRTKPFLTKLKRLNLPSEFSLPDWTCKQAGVFKEDCWAGIERKFAGETTQEEENARRVRKEGRNSPDTFKNSTKLPDAWEIEVCIYIWWNVYPARSNHPETWLLLRRSGIIRPRRPEEIAMHFLAQKAHGGNWNLLVWKMKSVYHPFYCESYSPSPDKERADSNCDKRPSTSVRRTILESMAPYGQRTESYSWRDSAVVSGQWSEIYS